MHEPIPSNDTEQTPPKPECSEIPPTGEQLETLRQIWESLPSMPVAVRKAYDENVRMRWDTHSNAIEGNSLKYSDTVLLILFGKTRGDHLMREYEEMQGHDAAILHMGDLVASRKPLSEAEVFHLHRLMMVRSYTAYSLTSKGERIARTINIGQYKTEPNMVMRPDGSYHVFAPPDEVPERMARFLKAFNEELYKLPADVAARLSTQHHAFVNIHPFDDGNGRMARLLLNYAAQTLGFPALVIEEEARDAYMDTLRLADTGDFEALRDFIAVRMYRALAFGMAVKRQECEPSWRNTEGDSAMSPESSIYDERPHVVTGT